MFTAERQRALLDLLERKRRMSNGALEKALRISPATLRRDLTELEAEQKVVRFHGGAAHPAYLTGEPSLEEKSQSSRAEKQAIAAAAVALVEARSTIFLDAGTTCLEIGRALIGRQDLTIIANSIAFAQLAREGAARVICLGGEVRGVTAALVGPLALAWVSQLNARLAFIGSSGLASDGPSTTELSEAAIKQEMITRAGAAVLVADASKWNSPSVVRIAPWSAFSHFISDSRLSHNAAADVSSRGPRVIRAKIPATKSTEKRKDR